MITTDRSSYSRAWTGVPCIGRQILNHSATGEVQWLYKFNLNLHILIDWVNNLTDKDFISVNQSVKIFA